MNMFNMIQLQKERPDDSDANEFVATCSQDLLLFDPTQTSNDSQNSATADIAGCTSKQQMSQPLDSPPLDLSGESVEFFQFGSKRSEDSTIKSAGSEIDIGMEGKTNNDVSLSPPVSVSTRTSSFHFSEASESETLTEEGNSVDETVTGNTFTSYVQEKENTPTESEKITKRNELVAQQTSVPNQGINFGQKTNSSLDKDIQHHKSAVGQSSKPAITRRLQELQQERLCGNRKRKVCESPTGKLSHKSNSGTLTFFRQSRIHIISVCPRKWLFCFKGNWFVPQMGYQFFR